MTLTEKVSGFVAKVFSPKKNQKGKTLQELVPFSDEELVNFHQEGAERFNKGLYDDACDIFLFLTQVNPKVGSFWYGLGMAEEKANHIQNALNAFILAAELETSTLVPYLHAATCFLSLDKVKEAKEFLQHALERTKEEHDLLKDKHLVEKMLRSIK